MLRRDLLKTGFVAAIGALFGLPKSAEARKKKREISEHDFAVIINGIEEKPDKYTKSCIMQNGSDKCDGTEVSEPFEATDFVIKAFRKDNPGGDPSKPILEIFKRDDSIQVTIYSWEGEETAQSVLKKNGANELGLLWLLRALAKVS